MSKRLLTNLLLPVIIMMLLLGSAQAAPSVSWGVEVGDVAVYWIDEILFSETGPSNLAVLLGDANRTNILVITHTDVSSLNYSLAVMNNTTILPDQQIIIEELAYGGQTLLIPSGDIPFVLPLSAGNQGNYFSYLQGISGVADFAIGGLLEQENVTNVIDPTLDVIYRSGWLNISASARIDDLASITAELLPQVNITDDLGFGENQFINSVDVEILIGYNTTDGLLMEIALNAGIETSQFVDNQLVNQTMSLNASIIRQSYQSILEVIQSNSSLLSSIADSNFLILGMVPALFIIRRKKV